MPSLTDNQLKETLSSSLLRDLQLRATAVNVGRSDDGKHVVAGVEVDAERSLALNERLDDWSEKLSEELTKGEIMVTVYALARCCGG